MRKTGKDCSYGADGLAKGRSKVWCDSSFEGEAVYVCGCRSDNLSSSGGGSPLTSSLCKAKRWLKEEEKEEVVWRKGERKGKEEEEEEEGKEERRYDVLER